MSDDIRDVISSGDQVYTGKQDDDDNFKPAWGKWASDIIELCPNCPHDYTLDSDFS